MIGLTITVFWAAGIWFGMSIVERFEDGKKPYPFPLVVAVIFAGIGLAHLLERAVL
jgi:hypothetical protein